MSQHPALERVAPIEAQHVPRAAALLAAAMEVDAAYGYLFPEPGTRRSGLGELFAANLELHRAHRCSYVALDGADRVVGTVTMRPPGGVPISTATMIRYGLLPFAFRHGVKAVRRLFWLKETYDALDVDLAGARPHWYVHMMAIDPELQGRGLGRALLADVMRATVLTTPGVPAVLTTHLSRNVTFYRRAGFETRWERTVAPPGAASYSVWGMVASGDKAVS
jgi:ribosomal protein S18 acetylase RimI-like enzyme